VQVFIATLAFHDKANGNQDVRD